MQRGNLIWACWQPCGAGAKPARVHSISSGAMLFMVTPQGARNLNHAMTNIANPEVFALARRTGEWVLPKGHFDVAVKNWLQEPEQAEKVGACYVVPPIGNYDTHQSGCDKSFSTGAGRPNCWGEKWCCPGTRREDDPKGRDKWLASFTKKGEPHWLTKVNVSDNPRHDWKSFWGGAEEERIVSMAEHRARKTKGEKGTGKHAGEPAAPAAGTDKGEKKVVTAAKKVASSGGQRRERAARGRPRETRSQRATRRVARQNDKDENDEPTSSTGPFGTGWRPSSRRRYESMCRGICCNVALVKSHNDMW